MLEAVVKQSLQFPVNSKMLIFGAGFSGQHVADAARRLGAKVCCSRRTHIKHEDDFIFNSTSKEIPPDTVLENTTHLLSCIPPDENGIDPVLRQLGDSLNQLELKWAGYLSTTGVYGDSKGAWVNEDNKPKPKQMRSIRRHECEKAWGNLNVPTQILRLPGIYGPGRSALETILNGKGRLIHKPGQIFSRIHIDDIAGAIMHLISLSGKGYSPKVINISDNLPSTNIDVLTYAATLIDKSLPSIESFEEASKTMSPMALSFWQENRRISNDLLCQELKYSLIHPNYKSGLQDCFDKLNL